ncbi:MAG TPA: rhodanese-like domain-containing protein, partial [Rhodocyclaceae bacterium]
MKSAIIVVALASLAIQNAFAQSSPSSPLVAARKSAVPAAQCPVDDAQRFPLTVEKKRLTPDMRCAISAAELSGMLGRPDVAVVDTRLPQEFDEFHGDGAMNLPASAVATKAFLKKQQVILLGSGKSDQDLYSACAELKAAGFSRVRVLQGGMLSWSVRQLPGIGRVPSPAALAFLSPAELSRAVNFDANVVLMADGSNEFRSRLPRGIALASVTPEAIKVALERQGKKAGKGATKAAVVLVVVPSNGAKQIGALQA